MNDLFFWGKPTLTDEHTIPLGLKALENVPCLNCRQGNLTLPSVLLDC